MIIPNYMVLKNPLIILYSFNVGQRLVLQIFLKLVVKQEIFCYIGFSLVLCTPRYFHKIFFFANTFFNAYQVHFFSADLYQMLWWFGK